MPRDPSYNGFDGKAKPDDEHEAHDLHDLRKYTLWGSLMAGGAGVEYYFGYKLAENDLVAEDYRSREQSWSFARLAIDFFQDNQIPFGVLDNADALVGNLERKNGNFCFAQGGGVYVVYLPEGGSVELDLREAEGSFKVSWYNPREGGKMLKGSVKRVKGGSMVSLGPAPSDAEDDWAILVTR